MWPFNRQTEPERRASFTEAVIQTAFDAATTAKAEARKVAAAEYGIGLYSRSFAMAAVKPQIAALTPSFMASSIRSLLTTGNAVYALDLDAGGNLRLHPAASYDITGSYKPESWRYELELGGPSADTKVALPAEGVVHFRIGQSMSTPWAGISPLETAGLSAELLARLERRLAEEANARVGLLLPIGEGLADDAFDDLTQTIANLQGNIALVEGISSGFGQSARTPGTNELKPQRLGADIPAGNVELRTQTAKDILAALGIPPMLIAGEGAALRESYRQLLTTGIQPIAEMMASELQAKIEQPITLSFGRLAAVDIAARTRAYGILRGAGMNDTDARRLSGLQD